MMLSDNMTGAPGGNDEWFEEFAVDDDVASDTASPFAADSDIDTAIPAPLPSAVEDPARWGRSAAASSAFGDGEEGNPNSLPSEVRAPARAASVAQDSDGLPDWVAGLSGRGRTTLSTAGHRSRRDTGSPRSRGERDMLGALAQRGRETRAWASEHRDGVIAGTAITILLGGVLGAVVGVLSSASDGTPTDMDKILTTTNAGAASWCLPSQDPNTVTTSGPGNTASPQGVIAAFEFRYYRRDVAGARSVVAPGAKVAQEAALTRAVQALPADVKHCVHISREAGIEGLAPNTFRVRVNERTTTGATKTWDQLMTTTKGADGQWRIADITTTPEEGAR